MQDPVVFRKVFPKAECPSAVKIVCIHNAEHGEKSKQQNAARSGDTDGLVDGFLHLRGFVQMIHGTEHKCHIEGIVGEKRKICRVSVDRNDVIEPFAVFPEDSKVFFCQFYGRNVEAFFCQCNGIASGSGADFQDLRAGKCKAMDIVHGNGKFQPSVRRPAKPCVFIRLFVDRSYDLFSAAHCRPP